MREEIPIFFSTDDNYIPFLDVAVASLIANASKDHSYRIIILNTGLQPENIAMVMQNECPGFAIDFVDISNRIEHIRSRFRKVYHFSVVTYYRLFIASMFPQYDKIVYLDCDLVVLGDISELFHVDLGKNILGVVSDQYVCSTEAFRLYAEKAIGVEPDAYFNAGVLLVSLEQFRKNHIEEQFIQLITEYDFDLLDPDQAYLNYLCCGKTHRLPNGWNKAPTTIPCEGDKNIVHYALYKKPWQYNDVIDGAFSLAVRKQMPVVPIFITMEDSDVLDPDGFPVQAYTLHILPAIYPDETLSRIDAKRDLKNRNYTAWVETYEAFYKKPLEYHEL